jgi:hypothetical protein
MTNIKHLFRECQTGLDEHRRIQKVIGGLASLASNTSSTAEIGRLLVEALGTDKEVKDYLQYHSDEIVSAITKWYMAARMEIIESQGEKK